MRSRYTLRPVRFHSMHTATPCGFPQTVSYIPFVLFATYGVHVPTYYYIMLAFMFSRYYDWYRFCARAYPTSKPHHFAKTLGVEFRIYTFYPSKITINFNSWDQTEKTFIYIDSWYIFLFKHFKCSEVR